MHDHDAFRYHHMPTLHHPQPRAQLPHPSALVPASVFVSSDELVGPSSTPAPGLLPQDLNQAGAPMVAMPSTSFNDAWDPQAMSEAVDKLKFFLATAPGSFDQTAIDENDPIAVEERCLNRFLLPSNEMVSCILWQGLYHITGTDIVRALNFRFKAFGRPVVNAKKFEEGIFSDLRNLKSGTDATLEDPKSPFLELLFKYNCIRTQKKQKVFFWFSVPHDRLFLDALDRDLKREKLGQEATTRAEYEPALSFTYNPQQTLFEQFFTSSNAAARAAGPSGPVAAKKAAPPRLIQRISTGGTVGEPVASPDSPLHPGNGLHISVGQPHSARSDSPTGTPSSATAALGAYSLFEGSPSYKQRRRATPKTSKSRRGLGVSDDSATLDAPMQQSPTVPMSAPPRFDNELGHGFAPHGAAPMSAFVRPAHHRAASTSHYSPYSYAPPQPSPLHHTPQLAPVKTFVCPLNACARVFKRPDHLKRHVRTHTDDGPPACDRCHKRFASAENLATHLRLHEQRDSESPRSMPDEEAGQLHSEDEQGLEMCRLFDTMPESELPSQQIVSTSTPYPTPHSSTFSSRFVPLQAPPSATRPSFAMPARPSIREEVPLSPGAFQRAQSVAYMPRPQLQQPMEVFRHRSATPTVGARTAQMHPSGLVSYQPPARPTEQAISRRSGLGIYVPSVDLAPGSMATSSYSNNAFAQPLPTPFGISPFGSFESSYMQLPSPMFPRTPSSLSYGAMQQQQQQQYGAVAIDPRDALRMPPPSSDAFALNPRNISMPAAPPIPSPAYSFSGGRPSLDAVLAAQRTQHPNEMARRPSEDEADRYMYTDAIPA